jgi:hypothetical protein
VRSTLFVFNEVQTSIISDMSFHPNEVIQNVQICYKIKGLLLDL